MLKRSFGLTLLGLGFFVSMAACTKPNAPTNENFVKAIKADMAQHKKHYGIYFDTANSIWGRPVKVLYDNKIYIKTAETQRMPFNVNVPLPPAEYQAELKRYNWLIKGGPARWSGFSPNPPYPPVLVNYVGRPIPPSRDVTVTKWRVVHKYKLDLYNKYLVGKTFCRQSNFADSSSPTGYETFCSIPLGDYAFDKILSSTQPAASIDGRIVTHVEVLMRTNFNDFEKNVEHVTVPLPLKFKMVLVQETNGWKVIESKKVPLS